ncbi:hypothetical protein CYY_008941 [Polysphondylium violaceum]|uniref:ABC transporter domain-containing protein n=1 Tax=Polysphondylium violaceum TaxID=133409 RepID=A0A8J4PPP3_9MYCE|nr:hypothetical protein CYY_008941 [Polysphondylium violaceum]
MDLFKKVLTPQLSRDDIISSPPIHSTPFALTPILPSPFQRFQQTISNEKIIFDDVPIPSPHPLLSRSITSTSTSEKQKTKNTLMDKYLDLTKSITTLSNPTVYVDHLYYSVMEKESFFQSQSKINILNNLSFYLKSGMMVLLIGGPGSGKSSLMKCLVNRTPDKGVIEGDILFNNNPINPINHHCQYVYVAQSDDHIPTLTVKETIDFSIECQSDLELGKKKELSDVILSILGLDHVKDTLIGNHSIRGISGGQKKRMTTAVELVKGPKTMFFDEISNGLDSSTSLELLSSLKMISSSSNVPILVSLLQPSPEIFSLFTHVLMLRDGKCTFFGEKETALHYFSSFGLDYQKQNPAEFLSNVYELAELDEKCPLKSTNDFVEAYNASIYYAETRSIIDKEKALQPPHLDISGDDNKSFQLSLLKQIRLNIKRAFKMTFRDRASLISRILKSLLLGIVIGSLFFQIDGSQKASQMIPSITFFVMMFTVFGSLAGVQQLFLERPIFYQQRFGKYYSPLSYFSSSLICDLFWIFIDVVIFAIGTYWMIGLSSEWDRFLFFLLIIYILDGLIVRFAKMTAIFSPTATIAATIAPLYFTLFLLLSGYMIPKNSIPLYWRWLHYISPFKYVYESLLSNQVHQQIFYCNSDELMPPIGHPLLNVSYPDGYSSTQVCPITHGDQILQSKDISTNPNYKFDSIFILLAMYLVFCLISLYGLYKVIFDGGVGSHGRSKPTGKSKPLVVSLQEEPKWLKRRSVLGFMTAKDSISPDCYLTWRNLSYSVKIKKANGDNIQRVLLDSVDGYVKSGDLLALMGCSGAGKSTLLDLLANRKANGIIQGEILLNGKPRDKFFNRFIAYVEQEDILPSYQTIREAITFSALLRLPNELSRDKKIEIVDYILEVLELDSLENVIIGKPGEGGISPEQRKRVNIGIEMASNPQILFLDEPTSNLDQISAKKIMNIVKKITTDGRSVICTIHQPSESIFMKFDSILLLSQGGYVSYFGPIENAPHFCSNLGYLWNNNQNLADFLLDYSSNITLPNRLECHDLLIPTFIEKYINNSNSNSCCFAISADQPNDDQDQSIDNHNSIELDIKKKLDIIDHYNESELYQNNIQFIDQGIPKDFQAKVVYTDKNATSFSFQFRYILNRFFQSNWRKKNVLFTRIARSIILSLIVGTLYLNMDKDQDGAINRISFIFFSSTFASISCLSNIPAVFEDRYLYYREIDSSTYRHLSYVLAMVISDLPFTLLYSITFTVPSYFISGLDREVGKSIYFFCIYYLFLQILVAFSQLLGMVSPSLSVANEISGITFSIFSLFAGFIIRLDLIPIYFKWLNKISITKYLVESLTVNEMQGLKFFCLKNQVIPIPIQVNGTVAIKDFCPIISGDMILQQFHLETDDQDTNVIVLGSVLFAFIILTLIFSRFIKYKK